MQELDEDEYEETKRDTLDQLREFQASLEGMTSGSDTALSLVSDLGRMKMAVRAAISDAFRAPEVIRMFALKQPQQLRDHLAQLKVRGPTRRGASMNSPRLTVRSPPGACPAPVLAPPYPHSLAPPSRHSRPQSMRPRGSCVRMVACVRHGSATWRFPGGTMP